MSRLDRSWRRFWAVVYAYGASDARILLRMRTPLVFMFLMPSMLALMLGPAVSGDRGGGASGRSLLGLAVMFSFMTINYVGLALFREFSSHTWLRQATYRPHRLAFLLGKTLPVVVAGLAQLAVFGAIALTALGLPLHGNLGQLALVAMSLVCCGAGPRSVAIQRHPFHLDVPEPDVPAAVRHGWAGWGDCCTGAAAAVLPGAESVYPALLGAARTGGEHHRRWGVGPTLHAVALIGAATVALCGLALTTFDYTREKMALS
jgi:ABC-2 type transport system permease protein